MQAAGMQYAPMVMVSNRPARMMSPVDSIVKCFQNYVGFDGRASRSEYWWFALAGFIASFIAGIFDAIIFGIGLNDPTPFTWVVQLAILLPSLAVGIRRMHDHGKSGWFILIPIYNIVLFATEGQGWPNNYGPVPTNMPDNMNQVVVQQPMQQQYQQPMQQQYQQPPNYP